MINPEVFLSKLLELGVNFFAGIPDSLLKEFCACIDEKLNEKVHDAFKAHCSHQMLPMELPGKLERRGFRNIKDKSLAFVITRRDENSPARYTEAIMANFALTQGMSEEEVSDWKSQLEKAEKQGRFGFSSFPVLTSAFLN